MDSFANNRIAHLVDSSPLSSSRTPAQQQASRTNGSMSRGPLTPEGKAKSRANAVRHGILAKVVMPKDDFRGYDILYRRIRLELMREFNPSTYSTSAAVDCLAHDYVRLARAKLLFEASQRPQELTPADEAQRQDLSAARRNLRLFRLALAASAAGEPWEFKPHQAERMAAWLITMLEAVEQDLAESALPDAEPLPDIDVELRIPQTAMVKAVGPMRKRFTDHRLLVAALTGENPLGRLATRRLNALVEFAISTLQQYLKQHQREIERLERLAADEETRGLTNISELLKIERYIQQLSRGIDRKMRQLRAS